MTVATRLLPAPAAVGFSPSQLTGLQLWLKADAITGLADAAAVTTWADASGNGRDVTQAVAGNKPAYKTNILNGRPVVRFDGGDVLTSASFAVSQPFVMVAAISTSDTTGPRDYLVCRPAAGHCLVNGGNWAMYAGALLTGSAASTSPSVVSMIANGASSSIRVNGPTATTTGNGGTTVFDSGVHVGAAATTEWWLGDIAEILIYGPALAAADLLRVERHLGAKYGISVS